MVHPLKARYQTAQLTETAFITEDGATLPLRRWLPQSETKAVLIALHGFNDYSHFFTMPAEYLSKTGIACFAYDQRGFGNAPKRGLWAGYPTYTHDLQTLVRLLKQRYKNRPIYLLGESMGGAVVIAAMNKTMPDIDGVILSSPALWARDTMPWYQTSLLWLLSHTVPDMTFTGESVGVQASDNIKMLRQLGKDPLVIKATRVETIHGLTDLMDEASRHDKDLPKRTLMLYGEKDEVIPKPPTYNFFKQVLADQEKTVAIYPKGYHLLLRDLHADNTWQDIVSWVLEK
ncbi:partial Monoacylglycerol lipase, partial [Anaerolineae bacterium]